MITTFHLSKTLLLIRISHCNISGKMNNIFRPILIVRTPRLGYSVNPNRYYGKLVASVAIRSLKIRYLFFGGAAVYGYTLKKKFDKWKADLFSFNWITIDPRKQIDNSKQWANKQFDNSRQWANKQFDNSKQWANQQFDSAIIITKYYQKQLTKNDYKNMTGIKVNEKWKETFRFTFVDWPTKILKETREKLKYKKD